MPRLRPSPRIALIAGQVLLPAGATAFVGFQAGGYFAGATGTLAVALGVLVAIGLPFLGGRRVGPGVLIAAGALLALAAWQLISSGWSHAPGRAIIESDRSLLYLSALLAGALFHGTPDGRRRCVWGIALGLFSVVCAGLLVRTLPGTFDVSATVVERARAAFPLTYWNALGLASTLAALLALHLSSGRQRPAARVVAAAGVPIAVAMLVLTFSRGAIAVGVVGLVVYVGLTLSLRTLAALLATLPSTVAVIVATYQSELDPRHPGAAASGHRVLLVVVVAAVVAVLLRALLARWLDARDESAGRAVPHATVRGLQVGVAGLVVAAIVVAFASGAASRAYDRFAHTHTTGTETRQRLTQLSGNGRVDAWKVALHMFAAAPTAGKGAGTFSTWWFQRRTTPAAIFDAHSVYVEALGELGWIGFALIVIPLVLALAAAGRRFHRGRDPLDAAVVALTLAWVIRAGFDWDWEMPAVTLWLFFLAGSSLAPESLRAEPVRRGLVRRVAVAVGLLAFLVLPAREAWSQHRLNQAAAAYRQGRCADTARYAIASLNAIPPRAEPYELIAFCDLKIGAASEAAHAIRLGLARDPRSWQLAYTQAVARAASGVSPFSSVAEAVRLNPREPLVLNLRRVLRPSRQANFTALADHLPLPPF